MSKTVDQRVVEMRFDNAQFERNVATTMSTLDKFKQKLNFKGATKGLESIGAAAKKVDMTPLSNAAETVAVKFSHMQMSVQHQLDRMVDNAINAGKRIVSALTVDPIKTGLSEYETKINAVQVIKANTRTHFDSDEEQMAAITAALNELNDYADRTIYNFAQMTDNVGKFVAQGLKVDEAAKAVQGLANLAGASGASAQDMARATYQMSQALGGTIRKMDWNSLRNANMATVELKNTLTDIAKVRGIDVEGMIKKKGTFEDTLEEGWLSGELFTEAMNIYSDVYSEAELKAKGFTEAQIKNFKQLAATANEATTEVKTVTQLWDVLKETAQSGWTQTWELLIGDFDAAKDILSQAQRYFSKIIDGWSDMRNSRLGAIFDMGGTWKKISDKFKNSPIGKMAESIEEVGDKVEKAKNKLEDFQDIVNKVWRGDYKNSDTGRFDKLEAEGWDHRVVQDLVNKGYQYKLTMEDVEASHKKFGLTMGKATDETKDAAAATGGLTDAMSSLSDEQLIEIGLTKGEIAVYRDLEEAAKSSGKSMEELIETMSEKDGREMLINSLKNAGSGLVGVFKAIKNAWSEIFPAPSVVKIYTMIEAIEKFSEKLKMSDETAEKLKRTFKGVFALVDILATILGGGLKIAFKAITSLLGMFDLNILDVTAGIGDFLVRIRDLLDECLDFTKIFKEIGRVLKVSGVGIYNWIQTLKDSENLPRDILVGIGKGLKKAAEYIGSIFKKLGSSIADALGIDLSGFTNIFGKAGESIREWFASLKESDNIPRDIIKGLVNGLKAGGSMVWNAAKALFSSLVEKVKDFLGIHSPSRVFEAIGTNIVDGLINGIKNIASKVWGFIKGAFEKVVEFVRDFDIGKAIALVMTGSLIMAFKKLTETIVKLSGPIEGLTHVLHSAGGFLDSISGVFGELREGIKGIVKATKLEKTSIAIRNFAIAIAILVGSLIALTFIPTDKLWPAFGVLSALIGLMAGLVLIVSLAQKLGGVEFNIAKLSLSLVGIGVALLAIAAVVKIIGGMDPEKAQQGIKGVLGLLVGLSVFVGVFGTFVKGKTAKNFKQAGKTIRSLSISLLILVGVMKLLAGMSNREMTRAAIGMIALMLVVKSLMKSSIIAGKNSNKAGSALLKMAIALGALVLVAKLIAGMEWADMGKAAAGLTGMIAVIAALSLIVKTAGPKPEKLGSTLVGMAFAMLILSGVAKILATMSWAEMGKAVVGLAAFAGIITLLVYACTLAGDKAPKLALTLLAMSIAIGILAAIAVMLGIIDTEHLTKGIAAVGAIAAIIAGLLVATKYSADAAKNLTKITIAIAVLVAAIALLSFIDTQKLAAASAAIGGVLGVFGLVVKACGSLKDVKMGPLVIMTIAIGVIAGAIFLLAKLLPDINAAYGAAGAISTVLIAMAGSMLLISKMGTITKNALPSILTVMAVVGVLAGILYLLGPLEVTSTITSALALSTLLIALAGAIKILSKIQTVSAGAIVAMGVLSLVIAVLAKVISGIQDLPIGSTIANTLSLSVLLTAMAVVCRIVSTIPFAAAIQGAIGFSAFVGIMAVVIAALGLLYQIPGLASIVADGGQFLADIGLAIGNFVGSIVKGIAVSVASALPVIGAELSAFMDAIKPFLLGLEMINLSMLAGAGMLGLIMVEFMAIGFVSILGSIFGLGLPILGTELSLFMLSVLPFLKIAETIKPEMLTGVTTLAGIIGTLSASAILSGISRFLNFGQGALTSFGNQLPELGKDLKGFAKEVNSIEPAALAKVNIAAVAVSTLAKAASEIPNSGGLLGLILGNNDLGDFGKQFSALGEGLYGFIDALPDGLTEDDVKMVENAADAIKKMAQAAAEIPNSGGLLGVAVGENDLGPFVDYFPGVAKGMKDFLEALPENFSDSDVQLVGWAADAVSKMANAAKDIPNSGGILGKAIGNNDLGPFVDYFPGVAKGIVGFLDALPKEFGQAQVDLVGFGADAVKVMADAAKEIPNTGGKLADWFGDNDLGTFSDQIPKVGTAIKGFATNLGTFTKDQVIAIKNAIAAIKVITAFCDEGIFVEMNLSELIDNLEDVAISIKDFTVKMAEISTESIDHAITGINNIADMARNMDSVDPSIAENFKKTIEDLAKTGVSGFVEKFTGPATRQTIKDTTATLIRLTEQGFKDKRETLKQTLIGIVSNAVNGLKTDAMYKKYKSCGSYLITGIKNGISDNSYKVSDQIRTMARNAVATAEREFQINSPSRVFMRLGKYIPQGLAIGIDKFSNVARMSVQNMSEGAIDNVRNTLSHLGEAMSGGLDNVQPTIRPVLDLSEVRARAAALDGMLSTNLSAGVIANVRAIDSRMEQRRQNGNNHEIVSAIKGLSKDLGKTGNTTYSINGITYNHGDEVENAVRTIVRAVKIGGRA